MKKREITIVADENNVAKVKETLAAIKVGNPNIVFTPPIQGSIGSLILLTVKVAVDSFEPLLEKIIRKRLKLFTIEDKEKAETALKKKIAEQEDNSNNQFVDSIVNIDTPSPHDLFNKTIDDYAKEGNYRALIAYYKDAKQKSDVKYKAKKMLPQVLLEVIQFLYKKSITRSRFAEEGINKLIRIGCDMVLEGEGYPKFKKYAAYYAVELCGIYTDNLYKLIDIANDTRMPKEACLKAAAKFGKVALDDPVHFKTDLVTAIRDLNTRWLETIYDIASHGLKEEEISQYLRLKKYLGFERK